jgi:hypothetical protein
MRGLRRDAKVCSDACRREKGRRAADAGRAVTDAKLRLAERCSKHPDVDRHAMVAAIEDLGALARRDSELDDVARLAGRVARLARRLRDRARYVERYGVAP